MGADYIAFGDWYDPESLSPPIPAKIVGKANAAPQEGYAVAEPR
jgi:hypothetical protein